MKRIWAPQLVASLMLLWALNPDNPYGYYILLRWVCSGVFAYLAFKAAAGRREGWTWILGITALVYNPVLPLHMTRELWTIVNLATIGVAIGSVFILKPDSDQARLSGAS